MRCAACRFGNGDLVASATQALCRACAVNIARFLVRASDLTLSTLWQATPPARESAPRTSEDELAFAAFKTAIEDTVTGARAHLDLAQAYREMGLACDAIREAANAIAMDDTARIGARALAFIFGEDARPDALDYVLRAMRSSS